MCDSVATEKTKFQRQQLEKSKMKSAWHDSGRRESKNASSVKSVWPYLMTSVLTVCNQRNLRGPRDQGGVPTNAINISTILWINLPDLKSLTYKLRLSPGSYQYLA